MAATWTSAYSAFGRKQRYNGGPFVLLALLLMVQASTTAAAAPPPGGAAWGAATPSCPISLTGRVKSLRARPGKALTVQVKLVNRAGPTQAQTITNGTVQLRLPLYTTYEGGLAKPNRSPTVSVHGGRQPVYDPATRALAWTGITLRPRGAVRFLARVRQEACYPGPRLEFAYAATFTEGAAASACAQPLAGMANVEVAAKGHRDQSSIRSCGPTPAPTLRPTPAPTRSCGVGEYRPAAGGPCTFCAPGTFWNQTTETAACLGCPANQTSLQGAARCYTPCPPESALDTTTLTCVALPPIILQEAAANNITINFNTTQVFVVVLPDKLEATVGAAAAAGNETAIIVLGPGLYPQASAYVLRTDIVIIADPSQGRRRLHAGPRGLQTTAVDPVIYATAGSRHFVIENATIWTDGVIFQGSGAGAYSGGVELQSGARGLFAYTTFRSCRAAGEGGGLRLVGASSCTVGTGSVFEGNAAAQGGALYVGAGCSVRVNHTVAFADNSAPRTSLTAGGGGAIYVASTASLVLDSGASFAGSVDSDVTVAGGTVACANPAFSVGRVNCATGCTGSYDIPASCPVCAVGTDGVCASCPKGAFGGAGVALVCELCPYGYTTVYPPSSTSSAACVPITSSPTLAPTTTGETFAPTLQPTPEPTTAPSMAPTASPTPVGYKAPVVARYYHDSCVAVPTVPSPPSFTGGSLLTAGSGGTYATLSAAIAAAAAGDRIQVLPGTIVEAAVVTVGKSLEIFGTGPTCVIQRDSTTAVISIAAGVNDVYIHDLGVTNNQAPSGDGGGLSSCITAATMQDATPNGATGIYIANCTFIYPKMGVSIDAAGWVVRDCVFTPNTPTPSTTIRALAPYGSTGQSFATGNTFNNPTEGTRLIAIAMNAAGSRGASFVTGYKGNVTIASNTISTAGGVPRAYIDTTGMFRQPGAISTLGNNGEFSLFLQSNSFAVNYTSSPCLFYASAGAYTGAATIQPFAFFNALYAKDNVFGARTPGFGSEKGALFFTSGAAGTLGSFGGGFFAAGNSFMYPDVNIDSAVYANAAATPNLLVVEKARYTAPSPPITPIYPGTAAGLLTVDGVQLAAGDRVFSEDTCNGVASGLYTAGAGAWARAADFAVGMDVSGAFFQVLNGTQFGGTSWSCTNAPGAATVGTNELTFGQL